MQHGDLSNRLPPRWLIVFEGVIGTLPSPVDQGRFELCRRTRQYRAMVRSFVIDSHTAKVLWDLTWRQDYKFDVATFLPGKKAREHVTDWLDEHNVPAANVRAYGSPTELGKRLAFLPDVYQVVHASPSDRFTYGNRGMLVTEGWQL
jgi:hypothetical protein